MDVIIDRCAGIDIDKRTVKVCVRTPGSGRARRKSEIRTFPTFEEDLRHLAEWLAAEGITNVAMESTGVYWKPIYYALEEGFDVLLVNATQVKKMPGRKTDVSDSEWIAKLLECGLLRGSFVPPEVIRDLRDLTRYRKKLIHDRTREFQRLEKVLEDAGIKVAAITANVYGASTRAMFEALISGERDPQVLAEFAKGRMRVKLPDLRRAFSTSRFRSHHAEMLRHHLAHIDFLNNSIVCIDARVDEVIAPFVDVRDRLTTIPGVGKTAAEVILAECGADMSRFPTPQHLASWAGMCPGNNESGGKRKSGRRTGGDPWLQGFLTECGWAARYTKDTYLAAQFANIARRRGPKRAAVAVGHSILTIAWHIISTPGLTYQELGGDYYARRMDPDRRQRRLVRQLEAMGLLVTVEPAAA